MEKRFGSAVALAGIRLDVAEGELVGLLGPDGAGKPTLVTIVCGLVLPSSGRAEVCGRRQARSPLGYLAELFRFPGWRRARRAARAGRARRRRRSSYRGDVERHAAAARNRPGARLRRVVIVDRGRVAAAGTPAELTRARGVEIETARGTSETALG